MLPCKSSNIVAGDGRTNLPKLNRFALILKRQSDPLAVPEGPRELLGFRDRLPYDQSCRASFRDKTLGVGEY